MNSACFLSFGGLAGALPAAGGVANGLADTARVQPGRRRGAVPMTAGGTPVANV